jgi:PIN domain nuclease of toxin-antitoxin system
VKLLLDTHTFLWAISDPTRIPDGQRGQIESLANVVYVSAVSVAEIMIKGSIGKLDVDFDPNEQIVEAGFEPLDFSGRDAVRLGELPFHHRDPFDRMLISQALERGLRVVTQDPAFKRYSCRLV